MPPITIGELGPYYLIAVDRGDVILMVIVYFALLMSIPYLANKPQPVPNWPAQPKSRKGGRK